ncbi:MAG: hypothetical protein AAGG51_20835 [Cyanobacteria bacterium P01_G01_bin.54]
MATVLKSDQAIDAFSPKQAIQSSLKQAIAHFQLPQLHPDLIPYIDQDEINHPLFHLEGGVFPGIYNRVNQAYAIKRGWRKTRLPGREWQNFYPDLPAIERVYKFWDVEPRRSDFPRQTPKYFQLLGDIWTDLEVLGQNSCFLGLFTGLDFQSSPSENMRYIMTPSEQQTLARLPDQLLVYRGHNQRLRQGMSWTLQPNIALQYALGLSLGNEISVGTIPKQSVLAYINRWDEDEIIVPPKSVKIIETIRLREVDGF